jgi:alkanesulfonate monooxygenase SsuD/methylene tetrahydromethanopterin reductase-like flavin-dependent oxidoreductase (luciferase family)
MTGVLVAETEGELRDRVAVLLEALERPADEGEAWLAQRRGRWVMGTPDEARERVAALERAGVERVMLQDFLPRDLDHVRLLGRLFSS